MGYIEELAQQARYHSPVGYDLALPRGAAYASYFPTWETQTPQYQQPNSYSVAQAAFLTNEFVYSIIIKRAMAEAKGHFRVNDNRGKEPEEIKNHALTKLIRHPNKNMTENDFWGIKRISQDIAGFAAFEIEYNMLGEPIRLWFMRPDWCSFLRGFQDPLKYIRYQPYGLAAQDIPLVDDDGRQKVLFFSNAEDFHPLYPGVRFFSPAMHAMAQIKVDNAMTFFLADFVGHGAKFAGIISIAQTIDQNISDDYKRRWREQHGGTENWSDPLILGLGATFSSMQMNFKDMEFPELDARTETRICNTFQIETIVADARAGLDVSSYNNKKEAVKDWYYNWVVDTWDTNSEIITTQMLPIYEDVPENFTCDFDVSKVYAMQEDRSERWKRARESWKDRMITLNVALKEAGLDPVNDPEGSSYYEAVSLKPQENVNALGEVVQGSAPAGRKPAPDQATQDAQAAELKKFRAFVKRRFTEGKIADIAEYEFKYIPAEDVADLIAQYSGPMVLAGMEKALKKIENVA